MADRLDQLSTTEYNANVSFKLNERAGKLYPMAGSSAVYRGKSAQITDRFDDLYLREKTTRNGDTNNVDLGSERRWVKKPPSANVAPLIDRDDAMVTKVDLEAPVVTQSANATRRYHDDKFVEGFFGTAWTGEYGDIAVPFKTANTVAAAGTGVTKPKLLALRTLIRKRDVDWEMEKPVVLLTPDAEADLLSITEYASFDYNGSKPLEDGAIKPWLGFDFRSVNLGSARAYERSSALSRRSPGVRGLPVFVPSGMHRAVWEEFYGRVTERDDKQFSKQVYAEACSAVTRLDEDKAFILEVAEPGLV